jgi:hypothetical protein
MADEETSATGIMRLIRRMSRSEVVRQTMRGLAQAGRRKPFGQVAQELGLIGSFDGPRDLGEHHSSYLRRVLRGKSLHNRFP